MCQAGLQRLLATPGVDLTARDREGRDPLLWAASAGSVYAVRALLERGADPASQDRDGLTALHCAASRGHAACLAALLGTTPHIVRPGTRIPYYSPHIC